MIPDTKISLILRLAESNDHDAWREFAAGYQPVIHWAAVKKGLQTADADEVVQQVMVSIYRALQNRPHDPERAKFRTWLFRVTHNAIINLVLRRSPDIAKGGSDDSEIEQLSNLADGSEPDKWEAYQREYERAVFRWAASKIQPEFSETTWAAFQLTLVEGASCEAAAEKLGKEIGSIYAARSRVMRQLRKKVEEFDESCQIE